MKKTIAFLAVVSIFVPAAFASAQTTIRPIEEFVDAQGTYCIDDGAGGCFLFVPPVLNFFGSSDLVRGFAASVDYAGLADECAKEAFVGEGNGFGTTFSGRVIERPLADGRAHVKVILRTKNALTWAFRGDGTDYVTPPVIFGQRWDTDSEDCETFALSDPQDPAFCNAFSQFEFINTAPGAPLPDMIEFFFPPRELEDWLSWKFRCTTKGPLREAFGDGYADGTPGKMIDVQIGLFSTPNVERELGHGGYPVEMIKIEPLGNKKNR